MVGASHQQAPLIPRNRFLLVAALAALSVGLLQVTHIVELPFGVWFSGAGGSLLSTSSLLDFMKNVGYLSLFVLMALESASLPIPSEVVLPFAGYLVYLGAMDFWVALAVSTAASLAGALVDYYLALWLGRPFVVRLLKAFRLGSGTLDRAERWFERSGQWTVFVARFVPGLRTVISLPAGLFRMGIKPFVFMTVVGCFAWSAILVYAGFLSGPAWSSAFASSSTVIDALSAVVAAVAGSYIVYYVYGLKRRVSAGPTPLTSVS